MDTARQATVAILTATTQAEVRATMMDILTNTVVMAIVGDMTGVLTDSTPVDIRMFRVGAMVISITGAMTGIVTMTVLGIKDSQTIGIGIDMNVLPMIMMLLLKIRPGQLVGTRSHGHKVSTDPDLLSLKHTKSCEYRQFSSNVDGPLTVM